MKKRKILLMSDDMRMHSGVACVSRDIIMSTLHHYDWAQIGGAINHPEEGKIFDMSDAVKNELSIKDAYLKIYPTTGYGNPDMLREIISLENPDAILHYTDPRFWIWLYQMEREVRTKIPLFYYNIWDDLPDPMWNEIFYRSCDLLMAISRQTYGINKRILSDYEDWQVTYVPHGISEKRFHPVNPNSSDYQQFKRDYGFDKYNFLLLYLNRNIRRKMPGDVVLSYKHFVEQLPEEEQKKCALVFHTQPVDDNGTDLRAVCQAMMPDQNVIFTYDKGGPFDDTKMNFLYNAIDVYINLASNEGFGLGSCEALTNEKPIVVNVTGGLQDQCGFKKEDGSYLTADDYIGLGSNHEGKYKQHGEWVKPVWPKTLSLQGSPVTPYIFDDRCDWKDAGEALKEWYDMGLEERRRCGALGREFVKDDQIGMHGAEMGKRFIQSMDGAFENWKPRERYILEAV
jgi:glycosyltransferase involved in cell wall biosynthesis